MSREFLVMKMVCAQCGSTLSLSYDTPKSGSNYAEGQPSGAFMVEKLVAIEPCRPCMEPLRRLQEALETLKVSGKKNSTKEKA